MARYKTIKEAAHELSRSQRTVEIWAEKRYITVYSDGTRTRWVDLDEIESKFKTNPHMRDGRKPLKGARIVPLPMMPVRAEVVPEEEQ